MLIPVENRFPEYENPQKEQEMIQIAYTAVQLSFYNKYKNTNALNGKHDRKNM